MRCETTTSSRTGQWGSCCIFLRGVVRLCVVAPHLPCHSTCSNCQYSGKIESWSAADYRTASGRTLDCRSFGDQQRAYLRGQLTVHKSIHKVNHIWRDCPHLSNYYRRIEVRLSRSGSSCTSLRRVNCRGWQTIGRVWHNAARAPLRLIVCLFFFAFLWQLGFLIRGVLLIPRRVEAYCT